MCGSGKNVNQEKQFLHEPYMIYGTFITASTKRHVAFAEYHTSAREKLVCACMIAAPVIGSQTLIGDDPSLQAYQNEEECFPFTEPWYVVYRNFELDPYFGQAATCIRAVETSPYASGSTTADVLYSPDVSVKVKLTLTSSPGYSVKNVITVESVDDASVKFDLTAVYKDCQKCKVFRHSYINEGEDDNYDNEGAIRVVQWQAKEKDKKNFRRALWRERGTRERRRSEGGSREKMAAPAEEAACLAMGLGSSLFLVLPSPRLNRRSWCTAARRPSEHRTQPLSSWTSLLAYVPAPS
ncbi:hypothetical protein HPB49_014429 [Dermacentor silvarum]|uniref:Uncharacterized protein n=1 Tax=Dermacentor silvarum TaxID=543639 RepID=A0ACB8D695_DERSI|nr:hypothetical protein HPB49_014429 [Dermacentor silvarum]